MSHVIKRVTMKYAVTVKVTIYETIEVDADSEEQARDLGLEMFKPNEGHWMDPDIEVERLA